MHFKDLDQLMTYFKKDLTHASLNPVRFINVETLTNWIQIKAFLFTLSPKILLLSNFCEESDIAPNMNRLINAIRTSSNTSLVIPVSEYLRINNLIAKKTIVNILRAAYEHNSDGKLRIYIPLYRMKVWLQGISLDPREVDCFHYLDGQEDSDYSLTIVQDQLNLSLSGNQTRGFQDYLRYWEQNPDKPVIFHTSNAIQYRDIIFDDDVKVIVTGYDLLKYHYHIPLILKEQYGTEIQWRALSEAFTTSKDLESVICQFLSAHYYSEKLFESWKQYDLFKRWLLWLWIKFRRPGGYLGKVIDRSTTVDDLVECIYTEILDHVSSDQFSAMTMQRRKLIKDMNLFPPHGVLDKISSLDPIYQLQCLTDFSQEEKRAALFAYAKCKFDKPSKDALRNIFPDASNYLEDIEFKDIKLKEYFRTYNHLKLTNTKTTKFLEVVNSIAKENNAPMWMLDSRNTLVEDFYKEDTFILFVDALGVEYLALFLSLFDKDYYDIEHKIGRCNLPSITKNNTDFLTDRNSKRFNELDELKHSSTIKYPENVITEFELMHEVKEKVDEYLENHASVIVTADHGSSRMAILYRDDSPVYQSKEGAQLEKYGRCCFDTINDYSEIEGIIHDQKYWIFANYSRFAEKGAPQCEIHGGASLEEMLVPVIRIRKRTIPPQIGYKEQIGVITETINVGVAGIAEVSFKLGKEYPHLTAIVENQNYLCEFTNGKFMFSFTAKTSGRFVVKLTSDALNIGEFTVNINKGISIKDFDI